MGRLSLWVLLGLTLFAVSLHDVQVSADVGPTESECRPYIEKAIHDLQTGEVHESDASKAASGEDSGGEGTSLEEESNVEGEVETAEEISAEEPAEGTADETESSAEAGQSAEDATPSEEAADEEQPSEEVPAEEENAAVEGEQSQEETASAEAGESQEEPQQDEAVSEEGDGGSVAAEDDQSAEADGETEEAASVEDQAEAQTEEDQTTEEAQSAEKESQPEESTEAEGEQSAEAETESEGERSAEAEAEVEGGSEAEQSAEAEPSVEAEGEQSVEAEGEQSAEVEGEPSAEAEGEQSAEVEGEQSAEAEGEQSAEAETEQSVEAEGEQSAEVEGEPSAEAEAEPSAEAEGEQSAEAEGEQSAETEGEAAESTEAEAEPSAETEGEVEAETSAEAGEEQSEETEGEAAQEESTEEEAQQSAETEGEASVEEGAEQAPESEEAAPSEEEEEEAVVKSRGRRSADEAEPAESEGASEEAEGATQESGEAEQEASDEAETEKTEAESAEEVSEGQSQEDAEATEEEGASTESGEQATESHPEDDLLLEFEIPDNLRDRKHINELLHLDEEFEAKEKAIDNVASVILRDLKRIYENAVKPLETLYKYRDLSNRHFADPEIFSKPLVLFMGPWSGGKSTIINYLTGNEYNINSLRTGADPSPAYFNILMHGNETEVLDGTQLSADYTFSGLQKFGQGLQDRLYGLKLPNKLLEKVNIVEIPGILEVRKQVSRLFPFNDACQWFIDRADIIFLVYDPAKLDVGPETEAILDQLKGREYQTRIVLNKADQVKPEELLRVQSALIWNISPSMSSAQPPTMYTVSLWSHPYETSSPIRLLQAQERAFLRDIRTAIDKRIEHKIASARRFAVRVRNHAKMVDCYLTTYYNHKTLFGNKKRIADDIIDHPQNYHIYEGLSTLTNISRYDLPDPEVYRDFFRLNPLYDFQKLSETCTYFRGCPINKLDIAIAYDLPELGGKYKKLVETALTSLESSSSSSTDSETSKS